MSSLFIDTDVEVVQITLKHKSGSGSITYNLGLDFWGSGKIYSGSSPVYPGLVSSIQSARSVGNQVGIRHDVDVAIYGKTALNIYGQGFLDLKDIYEFHGAAVKIFYYPKADGALTTHSDSVNLRQVMEVVNFSYEDDAGILTLRCRDTWFKDKELNKQITSEVFADLEPQSEGEWGSRVFGQADTVADGIMVDAPFVESVIDGSNRPTAKLFAGFTAPGLPNNSFKRLMVRNPDSQAQGSDQWLKVDLPADPQTAVYGDATGTPASSDVLLSVTTPGQVFADSVGARIITAARVKLKKNEYAWSARYDGTMRDAIHGSKDLAAGDTDFSFFVPVRITNKITDQIIICKESSSTQREYRLFYEQSTDRFKFEIFDSGGTSRGAVVASTFGSPSINTRYFVYCYHNAAGDTVGISVNAGTINTQATSGVMTAGDAIFFFGGKDGGASSLPLFGDIGPCSFWRGLLSSTQINALYNSGNGVTYYDINGDLKTNLVSWWEMWDIAVFGSRKDWHGRNHISHGYSYFTSPWLMNTAGLVKTPVTSQHGTLRVTIAEATYPDAAIGINSVKRVIQSATYDPEDLTTSLADTYFQFDPPVVLKPNVPYLVYVEWSSIDKERMMNAPSAAFYSDISYNYYYQDKRNQFSSFVRVTSVRTGLELYAIGAGDDAFKDGTTSGSDRYSYYHLEAKSITLAPNMTRAEISNSLQFKIGVSGIEDDSSGTYTGTPGALLTTPAQLLHLVTRNTDFGLGISTTRLNTTSFSSVSSSQASKGISVGFAVRIPMSIEQFIVELCRQGRMRFYKSRTDQLTLNWPKPITQIDVAFSEARYRADVQLETVEDSDESDIVNEFRQSYAIDILNQPKDLSLVRRAEGDKYSGLVYITQSGSTSNSFYTNLAAGSQTLFEKRENRQPLDIYDSQAPAQYVQEYFCGRFAPRSQRFSVRIPRKKYYNTFELFSTIRVEHSGIPFEQGTSFAVKGSNAGTTVTNYVEGTPAVAWSGGVLTGEIVGINEVGPWMVLLCQTVPQFNWQ